MYLNNYNERKEEIMATREVQIKHCVGISEKITLVFNRGKVSIVSYEDVLI